MSTLTARPFTARHPNLFTFLLAAGLAGLSGFMASQVTPTSDGLARALLLFAIVCLTTDSLETATLGAGDRRWSNPERWVLALLFGWYFITAMAIFGIGNTDIGFPAPAVLLIVGLVVGAYMGVSADSTRKGINETRYDLSSPATATPRGAMFYRLWPAAVVAVSLGVAAFAASIPTLPAALWVLPFLAFLNPLYRPKPDYALATHPIWPRLVGAAALVAGVLLLS